MRGVLHVSVEAPTRRRTGWWRGILNDVRSAQTWRELGYFVVVLPVLGTIGYLLPFAVAGSGIAAVMVPFLQSTIPTNPVLHLGIHRLGWWWLLFGVAALVAAGWIVQGCAYAWSWAVRTLLGRGVEEQLWASRIRSAAIPATAVKLCLCGPIHRHQGTSRPVAAMAMFG
jgi:Putative sensor